MYFAGRVDARDPHCVHPSRQTRRSNISHPLNLLSSSCINTREIAGVSVLAHQKDRTPIHSLAFSRSSRVPLLVPHPPGWSLSVQDNWGFSDGLLVFEYARLRLMISTTNMECIHELTTSIHRIQRQIPVRRRITVSSSSSKHRIHSLQQLLLPTRRNDDERKGDQPITFRAQSLLCGIDAS